MKKKLVRILIAGALACAITACGGSDETAADSDGADQIQEVTEEDDGEKIRTETAFTAVYIGAFGQTMTKYECQSSDKMTPEMLISTIAGLTGWNLDLADEVKVEDGKITVCFAKTSSLFVGLPESQEEEFMVDDTEQLTRTILDSVQYTLQNNYVNLEKGEGASYDIYYCMEGGQPLELPIGKTIPADEPYNGLDDNADTLETEVISSDE